MQKSERTFAKKSKKDFHFRRLPPLPDPVRWQRVPLAEHELLRRVCDGVLRDGVRLLRPAGDVHRRRVATDEGPVVPAGVPRHDAEAAVLCRIPRVAHSRRVLHVAGEYFHVLACIKYNIF